MSKEIFTRRLRLHLFSTFKRPFQCCHPSRAFASSSHCRAAKKQNDVTHDYEKRVAQLEARKPLSRSYPRVADGLLRRRVTRQDLEKAEQDQEVGAVEYMVAGRVTSVRTAGSKLVFMDVSTEHSTVQTVCQLSKLNECRGPETPELTVADFKAFSKSARKGDVYCVTGLRHRTDSNELSVLATALPTLLSPALHQIPEAFEDPEARARNRHVDMLVNPEAIQTLQVRHHLEAALQEFFNDRNFVKVTTPLLSAMAGGAIARPFETVATELSEEMLNLRIAPELWLKRLVVGGMEKVYELGPAFRNEGVDATHNPEFNICEFYQAYASLEDLMRTTEQLLADIYKRMESLRSEGCFQALEKDEVLSMLGEHQEGNPFRRVEFIPMLEEQLEQSLPDLQSTGAYQALLDIFANLQNELTVPSNPTMPRLLDALASKHLEPISTKAPIFITHHPACMSPLSKHFVCPKTKQVVAARAELFINGREYANMYEEENSPFEQRRKFEEQLKQREMDKEAMKLDESYLQALEWGLPPTGGWGCGIDRLVMLFSGRQRMNDVLAFGSLRNVVGLGKR